MSTTVGNGLTVDGTVKASQATQAGEAVVLGDDGLIPANLVASGGGKVETPYFYIDSSNPTHYSSSEFTKEETSLSVNKMKYSSKNTFGMDYYDGATEYKSIIFPKYGAVATNLTYAISTTTKFTPTYLITLNTARTQEVLNKHIRTNLRGNFKIYVLRTVVDTKEIYYSSIGDEISITISDEGIVVNSGNITCYNNGNKRFGNVYIYVSNIIMESLPEWC